MNNAYVLAFYSRENGAQSYLDYILEIGCPSVMLIKEIISKKFPPSYQPTGGVLVDLACGPGTSYPPLALEFKFEKVIAVDGAPGMISFIEESTDRTKINLHLQVADIQEDAIEAEDNSVDLVICCQAMSFLDSLSNVFKEAARILKKGRIFAFDILSHEENKADEPISYDPKVVDFLVNVYSEERIYSLAEENGFILLEKFVSKVWKDDECPIPAKHCVWFLSKL